MRYVGDKRLEKAIESMLKQLLPQENAIQINFRVVKDIYPLVFTTVDGGRHRFWINKKVKRMMQTKRGLKRAYAVFAHEIGHLLFHNAFLEKMAIARSTAAFSVMAEKEADKHAMRLLGKLYPDPKEILLDQIDYALKISLKHAKTEEKKELAKTFAKERRLSLSKLG